MGVHLGQFTKRSIDVLASTLAVLLLLPVLLLCCILVWGPLGRPVLFQQVRPGLKGKPFRIYKFRTMSDERDANGDLKPDRARLTRVGLWLRRTSLDELPELINIVKGDMSLVGPRPLLMDYLSLYSQEHARRMDVRPGLTGWAQVNGRNDLTWPEKLDLDVFYVDNRSLLMDFQIILKTIGLVLKGEGVGKQGHATTDRFNGYDE